MDPVSGPLPARAPSARADASARLRSALRVALRAFDVGGGGIEDYRRAVAQALRERFACSLATLWRLDGEPGARAITCVAALSDEPEHDPTGVVITESQLPEYLAVLAEQGLFNSCDAQADPRLAGILDDYLRPQRVRGLLDAAFSVNGRTFGVLCLEQRDVPREWTRADEIDLRRAAAAISLALTRAYFDSGFGEAP